MCVVSEQKQFVEYGTLDPVCFGGLVDYAFALAKENTTRTESSYKYVDSASQDRCCESVERLAPLGQSAHAWSCSRWVVRAHLGQTKVHSFLGGLNCQSAQHLVATSSESNTSCR